MANSLRLFEELAIVYGKSIKPYHSSAWRITIIFSALVTLIIGALLFGMYQQLRHQEELQLDLHLDAEHDRYQQMSLTLDKESFETQVLTADPKVTLVVWRNDTNLIGSLDRLPKGLTVLPKKTTFPVYTGGPEKLHMFTGGLMESRYGPVLIAARSDELGSLIKQFANAAITALMVTVVLTLSLGFLFSKAILRRLVEYNRLSEKIENGEYSTRLPASRRHDEFDVLAHQFNRVLDTLEQNLAAVRGVTDNIAHDLRTPLSHLRIGLEQLPAKTEAERIESCAILTEELDHCLATFDAMLSLTRISEGQQTLELQDVSLQRLSQDLFEMVEAMAEFNGQTISLNMDRDFIVHGDKYLLFQALFNLVDNAIKYSGEGATIEILQHSNQIIIKDNGPGIPDDAKEKVFERLVRLDPSRHHQGTGLGLSMVEAILLRHNASISLEDLHPSSKDNTSDNSDGGAGLVVTIRFSSDAYPA